MKEKIYVWKLTEGDKLIDWGVEKDWQIDVSKIFEYDDSMDCYVPLDRIGVYEVQEYIREKYPGRAMLFFVKELEIDLDDVIG